MSDRLERIEAVLWAAMRAPKEDYLVYKTYRDRLGELCLTTEEYQENVKKLIEILRV